MCRQENVKSCYKKARTMCRGVSQEKKARLLNVNCHKQSNRNMTDMCSIHKGLLACTPNIIYIYSMYRLLVQAVCESSVFLLTHTFSALCVCVCVSGLLGHLWPRSAHRWKPTGCHLRPTLSSPLSLTVYHQCIHLTHPGTP